MLDGAAQAHINLEKAPGCREKVEKELQERSVSVERLNAPTPALHLRRRRVMLDRSCSPAQPPPLS